jgi:hypothetical protein
MFSLLILFVVIYAIWYFIFKKKNDNEPPVPLVYPALVTISLVLMVLTYNLGLYGTSSWLSVPVVGLALANAGWVAAILLSLRPEKRTPFAYLLGLISVVSGAMLIWRANGFIQSVNLAVIVLTNLLTIFYNTYEQINWQGLWLIKQLLRLIPASLQQIPRLLKNPKSEEGKQKFTLMGVIKTISITALALIVFVFLLSAADPVFAQIIKNFQEEALGRTFSSVFLSFVFLLLITLKVKSDEDNGFKLNFLSYGDIFIPVVSLISLFAVFIVIQLKYLFGSHADFQSFNLTYSEYVRKGFIELLTTAFIGGVIAYIVIFKAKIYSASRQLQLKIVNSVLIGELFFMLASAFKRDLMYVDVYGLTRVRIVGGLFLIWLAGLLTLLLAMNLFYKMKEKWLWLGILVLSVGVWSTLNITNVDAKVAAGTPEHHDYVDYFYIDNLSSDGAVGWQNSLPALKSTAEKLIAKTELTDVEKSQLAGIKLALISLQQKRAYLYRKYADESWVLAHCKDISCDEGSYKDHDYNVDLTHEYSNGVETNQKPAKISNSVKDIRTWQHYSWSEYQAFQLIKDHEVSYFNDVDQLFEQIKNYQQSNSISLYKQEYRLLREFKYPFININLKNYYPQELHSYTSPDKVGGIFTDKQLELMKSNQVSVKNLALQSCSPAKSNQVQLIGMLAPVSPNANIAENNSYWLWDNSSTNTAEALIVTLPKDMLPDKEITKCSTCLTFMAKVTLQPYAEVTSSICPNRTGYKPVAIQEVREIN